MSKQEAEFATVVSHEGRSTVRRVFSRRSVGVMVLLGLLAACGVEQNASGDGWAHLGWYSTDTSVSDPELFVGVEEAEIAHGIEIGDTSSSTSAEELVLVFENLADGCGPSIFSDIETTATGLRLVTDIASLDDGPCEEFARFGVSVFAIDSSLLPENEGEITFDRDDGPNAVQTVIALPE